MKSESSTKLNRSRVLSCFAEENARAFASDGLTVLCNSRICLILIFLSPPSHLTYNGEVNFNISGGRVAKVHPAPVHAFVGQPQIVYQQLGRMGGRAEERPLAKVLLRREETCLGHLAAPDVEVVQWLVVLLLEPEHHVDRVVPLQWPDVARQAGLFAQHSAHRRYGYYEGKTRKRKVRKR